MNEAGGVRTKGTLTIVQRAVRAQGDQRRGSMRFQAGKKATEAHKKTATEYLSVPCGGVVQRRTTYATGQ